MQKKIKTQFECQKCGQKVLKWMGQCNSCLSWNSFLEQDQVSKKKYLKKNNKKIIPKTICEINNNETQRIISDFKEFDRVVGGGVSHSSLVLLGGEPGVGKSTLVLGLCSFWAQKGLNILYVSGEESELQVASRAKRLDVKSLNIKIINETNLQNIIAVLKETKPDIFILDSIQTTSSEDLNSAAGSLSQVREVTHEIMKYIKSFKITSLIIGHVTKDGSLAGPKVLEHMVDTVLLFEGDKNSNYRILRVKKNRFGNTNEVGIFEMNASGLKDVKNPSSHFLNKSFNSSYGRSVTCVLEGSRNIFIEVQALVHENKYGQGKRVVQGIDNSRFLLLIAIIEKYYEIELGLHDIYLNIVGGVRLSSRDGDLAIIAAILSSYYRSVLSEKFIFISEVGLTGELRKSSMIDSRLREMDLLKYQKVFLSKNSVININEKLSIKLMSLEKISDFKNLVF